MTTMRFQRPVRITPKAWCNACNQETKWKRGDECYACGISEAVNAELATGKCSPNVCFCDEPFEACA